MAYPVFFTDQWPKKRKSKVATSLKCVAGCGGQKATIATRNQAIKLTLLDNKLLFDHFIAPLDQDLVVSRR